MVVAVACVAGERAPLDRLAVREISVRLSQDERLVVATSYLLGSPRGGWRSWMAKSLGAQVEAFRSRPLDASPYTFLDALMR